MLGGEDNSGEDDMQKAILAITSSSVVSRSSLMSPLPHRKEQVLNESKSSSLSVNLDHRRGEFRE